MSPGHYEDYSNPYHQIYRLAHACWFFGILKRSLLFQLLYFPLVGFGKLYLSVILIRLHWFFTHGAFLPSNHNNRSH